MSDTERTISQTLAAIDGGQLQAAEQLLPLVYDDLRAKARHLMAGERGGHTLTPTALVHEAYIKLVDANQGWRSRTHFLNAAALAMRRILVDHARRKVASKRGGKVWKRVVLENADVALNTPEFDWAAIDAALDRFQKVDERAHKVVMLRFFTKCSEAEIAGMLNISERQVRREWTAACLWLREAMDAESENE
jgi:RNA polymerase sigma factor (TIGR02999 family)